MPCRGGVELTAGLPGESPEPTLLVPALCSLLKHLPLEPITPGCPGSSPASLTTFLCVPVASLPCQPPFPWCHLSFALAFFFSWWTLSPGLHCRLMGPDFSKGQMTPCSVSVACSTSPRFRFRWFTVSLLSPPGCPWAPTAPSFPLLCSLDLMGAHPCWKTESSLPSFSSSSLFNYQVWGISFSPDGCSGWSPYGFFDAEKAS